MKLLNSLKRFDAYPKTLDDFRVRTYSGGVVSIVCTIIIIWLFISELSLYLTVDTQPELFVDASRGEKLRINIDITFPDLPCAFLSVDAMDIAGEHQLDVFDNIFKKRLDKGGNPIGVVEKEKLTSYNIRKDEEFKKKSEEEDTTIRSSNKNVPKEECLSCYGAEPFAGACCNTCEDVREAYRKKGWAFAHPDSIQQCMTEGWSEKMEAQKGEGCNVYGFLLVNKVAGNFHFAPGKSFQQQHMHVHDLQPFKQGLFNVSHNINRLSFGQDFPGIVNPLDGVIKDNQYSSGMYQYFVKVVPTIYENLDGVKVFTNQFSVTENFRPIETLIDEKTPQQPAHGSSDHEGGLPGVFVMYDLSPIMVKFTERSRSFTHFLTGVCAIVGGIFTVAGLIDSLIYNSLRSIGKKMELGKEM